MASTCRRVAGWRVTSLSGFPHLNRLEPKFLRLLRYWFPFFIQVSENLLCFVCAASPLGVLKKSSGEITLPRVGEDHHDQLARIFRAPGDLQGGEGGCPGGDADQQAFLPRQAQP